MSAPALDTSVYLDRLAKVRASMVEQNVDTVMVSVGHDLPYLSGYSAMPLERLTMLVVPREGAATMVIPGLESARVEPQPGVFDLLPWSETEDLLQPRCLFAQHLAVSFILHFRIQA